MEKYGNFIVFGTVTAGFGPGAVEPVSPFERLKANVLPTPSPPGGLLMKPNLSCFNECMDKDLVIVSADNRRFVCHQLAVVTAFNIPWGSTRGSKVGH